MRILILSNKVPYPAKDGSSMAMRSMVDALLANNCQVHLLSINTQKHFRAPEEIQKQAPDNLKLDWLYHDTGIRIFNTLLNLFTGKAFHVSRFYFREFAKKLKNLLQEQHFDLVQVEGLPMAVYLPLLKRHFEGPLILRAHNVENEIWQRVANSEPAGLKRSYLKLQTRRLYRFERSILQQLDGLVAITNRDEEKLKEYAPSLPSCAIPCGINVDEYPHSENEPLYDLGYLASFDWLPNRQGLDWFMEKVWPRLREKHPQLTFALAGRYMPDYFNDFEKSGVKVLGEVASQQEFLQQTKILMVPLLSGSGMRIKLLEYLAMGKPVVSTSVGAEGFDLQNGSEIAIADQPEAFADEISALHTSAEWRNSMAQAGCEKVKTHYDNLSLGAELKEFYQSLL